MTRRINELNIISRNEASESDVIETIDKLKVAIEELGVLHDAYVSLLNESEQKDKNALEEAEQWYFGYVDRANVAICKVRNHRRRHQI